MFYDVIEVLGVNVFYMFSWDFVCNVFYFLIYFLGWGWDDIIVCYDQYYGVFDLCWEYVVCVVLGEFVFCQDYVFDVYVECSEFYQDY